MARSRPEVDMTRRARIAGIIRQKRLSAGLEQGELAARLGVTAAAVGNWERCVSRPDLDTIPQLCQVLDLSVTQLLGIQDEQALTKAEADLLARYRALNPQQQGMVRGLMEQLEWNDLCEKRRRLRSMYVRRTEMGQAAAAGFGGPMEDTEEAEEIFVRANPCSEKCTRIVRVNGQSMEPLYEDGSRVYVDERQQPRFGDDVVVIYEGTLYVKRFEREGLISLNPDQETYPPIRVSSWRDVRCVGKVIGRVSEYDIASGKELLEVADAFAENEA